MQNPFTLCQVVDDGVSHFLGYPLGGGTYPLGEFQVLAQTPDSVCSPITNCPRPEHARVATLEDFQRFRVCPNGFVVPTLAKTLGKVWSNPGNTRAFRVWDDGLGYTMVRRELQDGRTVETEREVWAYRSGAPADILKTGEDWLGCLLPEATVSEPTGWFTSYTKEV